MTTNYFALSGGTFSQDWSDTNLITVDDNWDGVPSIVGYRGDNVTGATGVDPRTLTDNVVAQVIDVIANSTATNTTGGIIEVGGANPTIAFQGSGTADAPYLVLFLDSTGRQDIDLSLNLRDLDASADNAQQQVAIQFRTSSTSSWTNVFYDADVTTAGSATEVTAVSLRLPPEANNQATLEIRIITTNAAGNDELVGIDDIVVASQPQVVANPGILSIADASVVEGNSGTTPISFVVTRSGGSSGAVTADYTVNFLPPGADANDFAAGTSFTGTVSFADGQTSQTIIFNVAGDTMVEPDETFTVILSNPTGGATISDGVGAGTIMNDDAAPVGPANIFINEIHYDNSGADANEAIEVAGTAGLDLTGYRLVLYNGSNTPGAAVVYATINLTGVIDDEGQGFGAVSFPAVGLQNGVADGIALIAPNGSVVQLLSYEGVFTAAAGTPAGGMTSTDIGVSEDGTGAATDSLQATGTGGGGADFTFQPSAPASFGMLNAGQTFIGPNGTGQVSIADASVVEGDSGIQQLIFTVRRGGGSGQVASVDYSLNLDGTASLSDLATGTALTGTVTFGIGESVKQIIVGVVGDTIPEGNETLSVSLSNPVGNIVITDGNALGTIINDDPVTLAIYEIQGESHRSAVAGQTVTTTGIVIAVDSNGFYIQDAIGDGNARTSDGIFVLTTTAPAVTVGDSITVRGLVSEFLPGNNPDNLTTTQITSQAVMVNSSGNALPTATLIGTGGILPPNTVFEDDGFTSFDPLTDAADFYESLEGMRVTIDAPLVTSGTNNFGETQVVASGGLGATGVNARGGITIGSDFRDFNPERIQIDDDSGIFAGFVPNFGQGDRLSSVTGVVNYNFSSYEVLVTEAVTVAFDAPAPTRETAGFVGTADRLTIATYNLENLDPTDTKFDILARDIALNLRGPDILAVQEIQDADGAGTGSNLSGTVTANLLISAIQAAGGPNYAYVEVAPTVPNSTGGEPNGNIRNGFFYNVDRVSFIANSAVAVPGSAFNGSRQPLAAQFAFNDQIITAISVHSTSRGGSDPLFGATQPPADAGDGARTAQATALRGYIDGLLAADPTTNIAVLGDFNGFTFENAIQALEAGGALQDLNRLLAPEERYSFVFEGNAQALDHILVTAGLAANAQYDAVHLNSEQPDTPARGTDHDPQIASFLLARGNAAPTDLMLSNASVAENSAAGTVIGTLSATDAPNDVLTYSLVDDAGMRFTVDAVTGVVTATTAFDFETTPSFTIIARATDQGGLSTTSNFTISVSDVNEAPTAFNDAVSVNEDATTANLTTLLLGNDFDPDAGDTISITSVNPAGTLGSLVFDAATQSLRYVADNNLFDTIAPGASVIDIFAYTITDRNGLTSSARVNVTVTGIADGVIRNGTSANDTLNGTADEDQLFGQLGNDTLNGLGANDQLFGGSGNDRQFGGDGADILFGGLGTDLLDGGTGNDRIAGEGGADTLIGGTGADVFIFSKVSGRDTINDFDAAIDRILLENGIDVTMSSVSDVNRDGRGDLTLTFSVGNAVTLLGISDIGSVMIDRVGEPIAVAPLL